MNEQTFGAWLFDRSPVLATATDNEGRLTHISSSLAKRLGYKDGEQLLGRRIATLMVQASRRRVVEDYRPILQRAGTLNNVYVAMRTRSGRQLDMVSDAIAAANADGTVESVFSIYTEIGHMAEVEERFRRLYRATPTMLHTISDRGEILEVSEKWLKSLGYKRQEVVGKKVFDFYGERTRRDLDKGRLERFQDLADYTNVPRELVSRDGRVIEVLASAAVDRAEDGSVRMVLVASKDMTKYNHVMRQLEQTLKENAGLREQLEHERDYLREEVDVAMNYGRIVGSSAALKGLLRTVDAVAKTPSNVLINGESGTGKELVAHAIHSRSERAARPLVKVNCASIPHELFESEFFGHVKGAFTGAHRDRLGRFELASEGTLFLDEVGEIPMALQAKLLRVLQEGEFERVGEEKTRSVDVRVIAATNRDLEGAVEEGTFREDLYYRLSVFPITVPPLREREDDVIQLASHFLDQIGHDFGRDLPPLTEAIAQRLRQYSWPGNIRELRNVLERAAILSGNERLIVELPDTGRTTSESLNQRVSVTESAFMTEAQMRALERSNTVAALKAADWRISGAEGAANLLGIKPSTLSSRMRAMDIEAPQVRRGRPALEGSGP